MDIEKALWELINTLSKKSLIKTIQVGTASEVTDTTCTVKREGKPDLQEVRLNAIDDSLETFVTVVPKEGSSVLVAIIENQKTEAVVISCSEVQKYKCKIGETTFEIEGDLAAFNNGENGGIPISSIVLQNLNTIKTYVTTLKTATGAVATAVDGVVPGTSTAFNTAMATATMDFDDMENAKVKH